MVYTNLPGLLVAYWKPQEGFAEIGQFPYRFNSVTRLSRGLLYYGCEDMGFRNIIEIPYDLEYVTKEITRQFAIARGFTRSALCQMETRGRVAAGRIEA
jgi:hypothetical protein